MVKTQRVCQTRCGRRAFARKPLHVDAVRAAAHPNSQRDRAASQEPIGRHIRNGTVEFRAMERNTTRHTELCRIAINLNGRWITASAREAARCNARHGYCGECVMRRAFREALMSAGTVVILLLVLIAADTRVRDQFSQRVIARPSVELASAGRQLRDLTTVIAEAARDQSLGHAPMLIFTLAAAVLVLFMLRT
jgi:hypothetical protein